MKKKFFIATALLAIVSLFAVSYTFAADNNNAVDGVRNFVGGAENVVENIGTDAANGIRSGINTIENGAQNTTNNVTNDVNNTTNMNNNDGQTANTNTNGYTATRTATGTTGTNMFANVSNNVWTWLIIAIIGIVIVAMVMYYAKQNSNVTNYHDDDNE